MWGYSAAEPESPTKGAYRDDSAPKYNPPTELQGQPSWEDQEDAAFMEEEGAGSYFAVGMGILIDEKIDYTIDGINYAIDAVTDGVAALGGMCGCGGETPETPAEGLEPIKR